MPTYTFKREDGEVFDAYLPISQYDDYITENKVERVWNNAPSIVSGVNAKPAHGFQDLLKTIHKGAGRNSQVHTY